jgi:hypothetical protein
MPAGCTALTGGGALAHREFSEEVALVKLVVVRRLISSAPLELRQASRRLDRADGPTTECSTTQPLDHWSSVDVESALSLL